MEEKLKEIYNYKSNRIEFWSAGSKEVEHDLGLPPGTVLDPKIEKSPAREPVIYFGVRMKLRTYEKWAKRYCGLLNAYKYRKVKK